MHSPKIFTSTLVTLIFVVLLSACGDDDAIVNPPSSEPPVDTNHVDTVKIDSIDALTICPPQEITIFGQDFPADAGTFNLSIGGVKATILSQNANSLTAIVPWDIADGQIILLDENETETLAEFEAEVAEDCDRRDPDKLRVTSLEPMEYCPNSVINVQVENPGKPGDYSFFIDDQPLERFMDPWTPSTTFALIIPANTEAGYLRILDNEQNEVFRSAAELQRKDHCIDDVFFTLSGVEIQLENAVRYEPEDWHPASRDSTWEQLQLEFRPQTRIPGDRNISHSSSIEKDGNSMIYRQHLSLNVLSDRVSGPTNNYVLRVSYAAGSDIPQSIELQREFQTSGRNNTGTWANSSNERYLIDISGVQNGMVILRGEEILRALTLEYSSADRKGNYTPTFTTITESSFIPGQIRATPDAELIIQLARP